MIVAQIGVRRWSRHCSLLKALTIQPADTGVLNFEPTALNVLHGEGGL